MHGKGNDSYILRRWWRTWRDGGRKEEKRVQSRAPRDVHGGGFKAKAQLSASLPLPPSLSFPHSPAGFSFFVSRPRPNLNLEPFNPHIHQSFLKQTQGLHIFIQKYPSHPYSPSTTRFLRSNIITTQSSFQQLSLSSRSFVAFAFRQMARHLTWPWHSTTWCTSMT